MRIPDICLCPYCHEPMQMSAEKKDSEGKVISRQFLCVCQGAYYENFHAGDNTKEAHGLA